MKRDLLVEIGTEELPPKSLDALRTAFAQQLEAQLTNQGLQHDGVESYATPRRLAVSVRALDEQQPDEEVEQLGPPVASAFDAKGNALPAAEGFAKRCGCRVDQLGQKETDKGARLAFVQKKLGQPTLSLLAPAIESALRQLPVARWMRWGAGRVEFVRPVHWVLCLFGEQILQAPVLGVTPGNTSRGHRFLADGEIVIQRPDDYLRALRESGKVIADAGERRAVIRFGAEKVARELGGQAAIDLELLDEVSALVEFPVAMAGSFDEEFLQVPQEALISSMQRHQKYFPVVDDKGKLLPRFIFIANLPSAQPELVVEGNERVIRPRLADARFFYQVDQQKSLDTFLARLGSVVYQRQLGTLHDKAQRIASLATYLAEKLGADPAMARRAGELCKFDLASDMVLEFDDLQGVMGRYYALAAGEPEQVAEAILEHYLPRQACSALPRSLIGTCVAIADRLDTLTGIFGIGQSPSGSKDAFGLRRASLALLRLIVEQRLHLSLRDLLARAAAAHRGITLSAADTEQVVMSYLLDRLPAYLGDQGISIEMVRSVLKLGLDDCTDLVARMQAVKAFSQLEAARALAAANKRVSNLLEKVPDLQLSKVKAELLQEPAERELAQLLDQVGARVEPLLLKQDYPAALLAMAELRSAVDQMFDGVMIMAEDLQLRHNRLALLVRLRDLFLQVADISELPSEAG